jgi:hypothetical protein
MKYAGLLVMVAGFFLSIAALVLFPALVQRAAFRGLRPGGRGAGTFRDSARAHARAWREPLMNRKPHLPLTDSVFALTLALLLLAPLAIAGVALINTGLGRSRSAAQALLGNLAMIAVAAIVFAVVGAAFTGNLPGNGRRGPHLQACRQAVELAGRRLRFCWAASARPRRFRNLRCSLSCWPWPWRS